MQSSERGDCLLEDGAKAAGTIKKLCPTGGGGPLRDGVGGGVKGQPTECADEGVEAAGFKDNRRVHEHLVCRNDRADQSWPSGQNSLGGGHGQPLGKGRCRGDHNQMGPGKSLFGGLLAGQEVLALSLQ